MTNLKKLLLSSLVVSTCCVQLGMAQASNHIDSTPTTCPVDPAWLTSPSLPKEVKQSGADGSSNFCDFYQFSTQTFLYLMSPAAAELRRFQVPANYPLLEFNQDGTQANSCDDRISGPTLRTSLTKADSTSTSTGQAGGGATIYAQDKNVVYYDVRFSKSLCNLSASAVELQKTNTINFPSGTTEIKAAWKALSADEVKAGRFVTQEQSIGGKTVVLGLVGMHVAVATTDHPEFVWATYEHKVNTPDCTPAGTQPAAGWTFASESCTAKLPDGQGKGDSCNFNNPLKNQTAATGTPTNICRVYPYGTAPQDANAEQNVADITQQNRGVDALLNADNVNANMKVLQNYFLVGALWVSDIGQNSGGVDVPNERGSLRLANTVAETDYQHVDLKSTNFISNCFGCHNYVGTKQRVSNNITQQNLSHTFLDIQIGQGKGVDVTATDPSGNLVVIGDNSQAPGICGGDTGVCKRAANNLKWNGQWTNINPTAGSVCGCVAQ